MIAVQGRAKRPSGASSSGPRPGTVVAWRLAQPIIDLARQAEELGWPILGIVGNTEHLRKHGDHTPWSRGKTPGVIYAIDVDPPAGFEAYYVARCRRADYDTQWIDFININGRQFNAAGVKVANSSDEHLHISVAKGHEDTHVTLFRDYAGGDEDMPTAKEVAEAVWGAALSSPALDKGAPHGAHEGVINAIVATRQLKELTDTVTGLVTTVNTLKAAPAAAGGAAVDLDALAEKVVARIAGRLAGAAK